MDDRRERKRFLRARWQELQAEHDKLVAALPRVWLVIGDNLVTRSVHASQTSANEVCGWNEHVVARVLLDDSIIPARAAANHAFAEYVNFDLNDPIDDDEGLEP